MQVERICFQSSCVINTVKYVQIKSVMLTRIFNPDINNLQIHVKNTICIHSSL